MSRGASLDHVGVVGHEIVGMLEAYRKLGFAPTEPRPLLDRDPRTGAPVALGQESAHLVFRQGYVELTAVTDPGPAHHLSTYLQRLPALAILALGTDDALTRHAQCVAAGMTVRPVRQAVRAIDYGERHGEARFDWFMVDPAVSPEGLVCFVQHRTPELVFQPAVQAHPNGVGGLAGVYLLVDDVRTVAERLAVITGGELDGAGRVALRGGWLQALDPDGFGKRFPGYASPTCPGFAGFAVTTADLRAARALAADRGTTPNLRSDGSFWVGPERASGCIVEFIG